MLPFAARALQIGRYQLILKVLSEKIALPLRQTPTGDANQRGIGSVVIELAQRFALNAESIQASIGTVTRRYL